MPYFLSAAYGSNQDGRALVKVLAATSVVLSLWTVLHPRVEALERGDRSWVYQSRQLADWGDTARRMRRGVFRLDPEPRYRPSIVLQIEVQYRPSIAAQREGSTGMGVLSSRSSGLSVSHPRVHKFVRAFQTRARESFREALARSGRHVERMAAILQSEGVPAELAYLPLIESEFRSDAVSHAGAVGPWQFIAATGRHYGLRIDQYIDERRDPLKSTRAAARYLHDLYAVFGDWHLSLAAYNTGARRIARILKKGRAANFWEMSDRGYLCRETRDFVPKFLAALRIAREPEAYEFDSAREKPLRFDLVSIQRSVSLSEVAQRTGTSTETIRAMNPALRRGVLPPGGYVLRLPKEHKQMRWAEYASLALGQPRSSTMP